MSIRACDTCPICEAKICAGRQFLAGRGCHLLHLREPLGPDGPGRIERLRVLEQIVEAQLLGGLRVGGGQHSAQCLFQARVAAGRVIGRLGEAFHAAGRAELGGRHALNGLGGVVEVAGGRGGHVAHGLGGVVRFLLDAPQVLLDLLRASAGLRVNLCDDPIFSHRHQPPALRCQSASAAPLDPSSL
jgi:hypothetical protein